MRSGIIPIEAWDRQHLRQSSLQERWKNFDQNEQEIFERKN